MTINEIIDDIMVSNNVHPLIHTQVCIEHKLEHPNSNCAGCVSYLPCMKLVTAELISFDLMNAPDPDFNKVFDTIQAIARMTTVEEVKAVIP